MSKRLTIDINGKQVVAEFGANYFFKHFKELSGVDLMADSLEGLLTVEGFPMAAKMVVAGNMAVKSIERLMPTPADPADVTVEEVEHFFYSCDLQQAYKIITDMVAAWSPKKEEEKPGEEQTQEAVG